MSHGLPTGRHAPMSVVQPLLWHLPSPTAIVSLRMDNEEVKIGSAVLWQRLPALGVAQRPTYVDAHSFS